ncbi:MAG: MHYT domain-containing protein, partial [Pseudomonas sp.]
MLIGSYSSTLVFISLCVAILASYTALDLTGRITTAKGRAVHFWTAGGGFAMGIGVWSMHFIGMLAFQAPIEIQYDLPITLFSLLIALLASWLAMYTLSHAQPSLVLYLKTALLIGLGIAGMHYVGMAAMQSRATAYYEPSLFALSIAIAIGASFAALWVAGYLREGSGMA